MSETLNNTESLPKHKKIDEATLRALAQKILQDEREEHLMNLPHSD